MFYVSTNDPTANPIYEDDHRIFRIIFECKDEAEGLYVWEKIHFLYPHFKHTYMSKRKPYWRVKTHRVGFANRNTHPEVYPNEE